MKGTITFMDTLLLVGVIIFFGVFGGKIFKKLKLPQVVGYIIVGALLGESLFGIIKQPTIELFTPFINLALGIIGFRIGTELRSDIFKKYGASIYTILFSEGLLAFIVVTFFVTLVSGKLYLGLLLGAVASATAPAATTDVLWEYKTKGPLTSILQAIVALDDGLSLVIYGFASVFAMSLLSSQNSFSFFESFLVPLFELGKSCGIGILVGVVLIYFLRHTKDKDYSFCFVIAAILLSIGVATYVHADFLLSVLLLGAMIVNFCPVECRKISETIEKISPPIYIVFFVLVGARLQPKLFLVMSITSLAIVYVVSRTFGKMFGAWLGAVVSKSPVIVKKYLGMCLFSQAGVAIGLAMVIYHNFSLLGPEGEEVGLLVLNVVTATTFIVQLIGPMCVKFAVTKADEIWRNVTKEDIVDSMTVGDAMRKKFSAINEKTMLNDVIETVKETDSYHFPVTNDSGELLGLISLGNLRDAFLEEQLNVIVLAKDIVTPIKKIIYQKQPLKEAVEIFERREVEYLPVVEDENSKKVVGILEYYPLMEKINTELIKRHSDLENSLALTSEGKKK